MTFPAVLTEDETLDRVLAGMSLARFGDGEINLCNGGLCVTQPASRSLQAALLEVIRNPGACLVGIPHLRGPKQFWLKYEDRIPDLFPAGEYGSAFITRPDSAPWIDTPAYWAKVRELWEHKRVTLIRGSEKSLTADMITGAASVREIIGPARNAWPAANALMDQIGKPEIVLLCLGPTATVMAHQLCLDGFHAVDLGHLGMFLRKHDNGEAMTVTEADKAWDRRNTNGQ